MNAQDKPITPAEDRALEIAGRLVAEWNEMRRDNLGALIRRIAAVLMEAEARGMERAAKIAEAAENEEGSADERLSGLAERIREDANNSNSGGGS